MQHNQSIAQATLIGKELAFVTFIRDYLQFGFDGPVLNAYVNPVVFLQGKTHVRGDADYSNIVISLINKIVKDVLETDKTELRIELSDEAAISIPLQRDTSRFGAEAAVLFTDDRVLRPENVPT